MAQSRNRRFERRYRYYEILGISKDASPLEIKRAYLKLAKTYHPDKNPIPEAHEKLKRINVAYEVLSKPVHRATYDNSPAECPDCWTHEVIQTIETQFRCRHCGCKFDPSRAHSATQEACLNCGRNLSYDAELLLWRCKTCKRVYTYADLRSKERQRKKAWERGEKAPPRRSKKTVNHRIQNWLIALLFIFALSFIGLGISVFVGFFIPFWILFGFSIVFSIEKWFSYQIRRHKFVAKLYRLLVNLTILTVLGLIIWSGIKLFSQQSAWSSLAGSLIFLGEVVFFIWMWRVVSKNSWRWPSMKLTVFSLLAVTVVFAFAGVQPVSTYKDSVIAKWDTYWAEQKVRTEDPTTTPTPLPIPIKPTEIAPTIPTKSLSIEEIEKEAFNLINQERRKAGLMPTVWDANLYNLSKAHTEEMANKGELFHTPMGASYAENAWGAPWGGISKKDLANRMVNNWTSSPLHRAWILHIPLRTSVVSIVDDNRGQYASWTFWTREAGEGPPLIKKAYNMWMAETGGGVPWLTWLYDVKGYPNNTSWLIP